VRCAGSAGKAPKAAEKGLKAHLIHGLTWVADLQALVRFDRLVQPGAECSAGSQAAGALVKQHDLAFLHHVVLIAK